MSEAPAAVGQPMFSRDELLRGLPARRASTILFAIEGTTARLVAASRINRAGHVSQRTSVEHEQAFLRAMATGGDLPRPPTIMDLERFSAGWAELVPEGPDDRAAIARLLARKYTFRWSDVPRLRRALGLDDPMVTEAYQRANGQPLAAIYAAEMPLAIRVRWRLSAIAARFDRMSPFWIAFFLALTEALGEGFLSLPLALAGFGPLPGVVLLIVLGAVNLITVGAMAEAVIRNGSMRYGITYIGRLVSELLGRVPASTLGIVFAFDGLIAFWFYFLGFGSVLAGGTGIPMGVWLIVLLLINIVVLRNESLDDTIASAVVIGTTTLVLAGAITIIALLNVDPANVGYTNVPLVSGRPFDAATVGLAFGIILMAFFGHTSAANSAKLLLTLEPTGRSLMRGNLAAMTTVIALYCVASVAILGVLGPAPLIDTNGTALTPLAETLGPFVGVLCVAYTLLAIGIGSLYVTLGTYNQVVELLPRGADQGRLGRLAATRRGRALFGFAPAVIVCLVLEVVVYLGVDDFAGAVSLGGTLTVPIITGVFPCLLVWAARRRGEYVPGGVIRLVGHPVMLASILVLYVAAVFAHVGIWEQPLERLAALGATGLMIAVIAWVVWKGSIRPRAVVELCIDRRRHRSTVSAVGAGRTIALDDPVEGMTPTAAAVALPSGAWRELRVWAHEVTADGWSVALPASVVVESDGRIDRRNLPVGDPDVIPIDGGPATVRVQLVEVPSG